MENNAVKQNRNAAVQFDPTEYLSYQSDSSNQRMQAKIRSKYHSAIKQNMQHKSSSNESRRQMSTYEDPYALSSERKGRNSQNLTPRDTTVFGN